MFTLKHNGNLDIAVGLSAGSKSWKNKNIAWSELLQKLSTVVRTSETFDQFIKATKAEQSKIKDVGGFVGGYLTGGKRSKENVLHRQLLTLDIDFGHKDVWDDFLLFYSEAAVLHSTHKSSPDKPRYRLVMPLDREVTPEEYQAIARKVAETIGIDLFDTSTFDVNRLMFWPSVSADSEYYFEYQDGPFLSADCVLSLYTDWHDTTQWAGSSAGNSFIQAEIKKQEDPLSKGGIVGVFCRTYSIQDAIATFLEDEYIAIDDTRYTYTKGTTAGGLICYDDKFAYSHHGTDPASGRLCNAFDLVRIHKFGHLDTGRERDDKDRKSFRAMEDFATKDPLTRQHIAEEKFAEAKVDFIDEVKFEESYDNTWVRELEASRSGEYMSSANNINLIFANDQCLKQAFKQNIFDNKPYATRSLPWRKITEVEPLRSVDYSGVRNYIECVYGISASQKVEDALALEIEKQRFHPITDYLSSLKWDGKERIDTLLIEYFGAADNAYTRTAIRVMLCAAVARVFDPGVKFDLVLVLAGEQGTYKSTFVKKLGKEWFSDTFTTVQGKEAFEQVQGAWIIEIAELAGLKKAEVESIKHYVAKREDSFRPAYGRVVETFKRQCVFFGTTNNKDFLRDSTGNRRFMPIDVVRERVTKNVIEDLTPEEIDQIWAEATYLYKKGEPLYLSGEAEALAKSAQADHTEVDERFGIIDTYLNKLYPSNWEELSLYERRHWIEDPLSEKGTQPKNSVCIAEIWCECLGKEKTDMSRYNTRDINEILKAHPDWELVTSTKRFPIYGVQKYYKRKNNLL